MTDKQTTSSRRRVAASQGAAIKDNAIASRLVAAYLEGVTQLESARNAFDGARVTQLDILVKAVAGLEPISEADWDRDFKAPVGKALLASGRYQEKSLPPKVAALKVVLMGLTWGLKPRDGDTVKLYEDYARQQLTNDGGKSPQPWNGRLTPKASGAKRQSAEAKAAKEAKRAQVDYVKACEQVTLGKSAFAADLALCMADPEAREELRKLVAEIAEDVRAKDKEEAKTSRRRR